MIFSLNNLKQITIKRWSVIGLGFLIFIHITDNILFVKMPHKIITQTESRMTEANLAKLEIIDLQKYKTNHTRVFKFKGKYREFLKDCKNNRKDNLYKWVTGDVCKLFSIDNQNIEKACYNEKEDIFVIVLRKRNINSNI